MHRFFIAPLAFLLACAASLRVQAAPASPAELRIPVGDGELVVRALADNAMRVRFAPPGSTETPSQILVENPPAPRARVTTSPAVIRLATGRMSATYDRATGALTFADAAGRVLLAEKPGSRLLRPATIQNEPTFAIEQAFLSPPDERLFGTGQFQDGHLDVRGLSRRLTQLNTQIAIPFLLSSKGYALLWHNYGLVELNPGDHTVNLAAVETDATSGTTVSVTTTEGARTEKRSTGQFTAKFTTTTAGRHAFLLDVGRKMGVRYKVTIDDQVQVDIASRWLPPTTSWFTELSAGEHTLSVQAEAKDVPVVHFRLVDDTTTFRSPVADTLDYVVFAGTADEAIGAYRQLTGPAPLMPLWSLGYIHCRERYKTQNEIVSNATEFRKRGLPMDLIVQDWQYWGRHGWNAMAFDEKDYPDPAAMVRDLHSLNARVMLSVWSKIDAKSELGKQIADRGYFIPRTTWVDFFNPEAAAFYWKNFSEKLLPFGIDAWWLDATEPENDDLQGRRVHTGPGEKVRNLYPLLVSRTVYEGQRADAPDRRVCILTRSAFPGQQRYASATWSGDIDNDWGTFRRQIAAGLDYVATGLPYWTTDAGGFFRPGSGQFKDTAYHERFLRWFQYATFCPLQRVHGYQTDTEFWRYGEVVEDISHRYLDLRYRLLPYIYSRAAAVTFNGSTLMRPLVMDFPGDPAALDQTHQFMFGPALLVAPVHRPDVRLWPVYLPKTPGGWFDFWTGEKHEGGRSIETAAPLDRIPLFVRAGSILPLGPTKQFSGEKPADPLELRIYRGADGTFELYEDDGVSYAYEQGRRATIPITWNEKSGKLTLGKRVGDFPGMLAKHSLRVVWVKPGTGIGIPPAETATEATYTGRKLVLRAPSGS